jgi:hypothetical protein
MTPVEFFRRLLETEPDEVDQLVQQEFLLFRLIHKRMVYVLVNECFAETLQRCKPVTLANMTEIDQALTTMSKLRAFYSTAPMW